MCLPYKERPMKNEKKDLNAESTVEENPVTAESVATNTNAPVVHGDKVLTKEQKRRRAIIRWLLLIIGIIMMSASVYFFQTPNDLTLGGVAGIALILSNLLHNVAPWLTQAVLMAIINVSLLILGLIILGKQCTIRTIFCSLAYTFLIWLCEYIDVIGLINQAAGRVEFVFDPEKNEIVTQALRTLTDEPFLELVYAILLFGIGGALIFNCGASSGGTDIIALILKKFTNLNVGFALMLIDLIVVCISFSTFTTSSALFSLMGLFTKSFLLDSVIESIGKTKYITIITSHPDIISEYILKVIQHGYTKYDAEGGYTGEPKKVIVTVCKRGEALKIKSKVKEVDPTAFVIINDAKEILGKGFGETI